jgi:hypothetical protein
MCSKIFGRTLIIPKYQRIGTDFLGLSAEADALWDMPRFVACTVCWMHELAVIFYGSWSKCLFVFPSKIGYTQNTISCFGMT